MGPMTRAVLAAALWMLQAAAAPGQEVDPEPEVSDRTVAVEDVVADAAIESRLVAILEATERYPDVEVAVREGVVILDGTVHRAQRRDWIEETALRTDGVVAVINEIAVEPRLWSLEPSLRELRTIASELVQTLPITLAGALLLLVVWILARLLARPLSRMLASRSESEIVRLVVEKVVLVGFGLTGVYLFLRVSGLTQVAAAVIGGTGVAGLIVGFAFRDIAENFLAGLLLAVQRPFRIDDTIEVEGHVGVVQKMTMRGTLLMDFDGNHIQVANSTVYKSTLKNYSANPKRRVAFDVGIGYDASVVEAQEIIMGMAESHSAVCSDPPPVVLVEALGAATVTLRVYVWIDGGRLSVLKSRSSLMRLCMRALQRAGISMPDEAREIVFPDGVPVRPLPQEPAPESAGPDTAATGTRSDSETSEGEGDLLSEVADLQRQARLARDPDEATDLVADDRPENAAGR